MPLIYHKKRWIVFLNKRNRVQQRLGCRICLVNNNLKLPIAKVELAEIIEFQTSFCQFNFQIWKWRLRFYLTFLRAQDACQICNSDLLVTSTLYCWPPVISLAGRLSSVWEHSTVEGWTEMQEGNAKITTIVSQKNNNLHVEGNKSVTLVQPALAHLSSPNSDGWERNGNEIFKVYLLIWIVDPYECLS